MCWKVINDLQDYIFFIADQCREIFQFIMLVIYDSITQITVRITQVRQNNPKK